MANHTMDLLQERYTILEQARKECLEPCVHEHRNWTPAEEAKYGELMRKVDGYDRKLAAMKDPLGFQSGRDLLAQEMGGEAPANGVRALIYGAGPLPGGRPSAGPQHWRDKNGQDVLVLGKDDSVASALGVGGEDLSFGRFVKAAVTGDWTGAQGEHEAMKMSASLGEGSGITGGYMVPSPLSARVLDLVRAKMVLNKAGCQTVVMGSKTLEIAALLSDVVPTWRAENVAITEGDPTFGGIQLTAHTLAALIKAPIELLEDAANMSQVVENSVAQAIAHTIDFAGLAGSGANDEPTGILNWPAIPTVTLGTGAGASPTYATFSEAYQALQLANAPDQVELVASPRTFGSLERLQDTLMQPLRPPQSWASIKQFGTSAVPINETVGASNDCSFGILGDFTQLMMGMRTSMVLEASRWAGDASGGAFSSLQVWIRAYTRIDFAVARPTLFQVIKGIRP